MIYFMDTEFIEDGKTIDLMSIGIVDANGATYYAESTECDLGKADKWVRDNVIVHLKGGKYSKTRKQIKEDILNFIIIKPEPEFWAYYADYDWVAFCQLFGRMIDLPKGFPMYCNDFKQVLHFGNIKKESLLTTNAQEHNALADAFELRDMFINYSARKLKK